MSMLHEILAVEKTKVEGVERLLLETSEKFGKAHFFHGYQKTLKMLADSPENDAIERAAREVKAIPTTVYATLEYMLDIWAEAEDVLFQKNCTNAVAKADIILDDKTVVAKDVPVDELMGLEVRLGKIKGVFTRMPTIDAAIEWKPDATIGKHVLKAVEPEQASKSTKTMYAVVLYEATKDHPAQVKEATKDEITGIFTKHNWTTAVTAQQKADTLKRVDDLLVAVKAARMRANKTEVVIRTIGKDIVKMLLAPLN